MIKSIKKAYKESADNINEFITDQENIKITEEIAEVCSNALEQGNKILICGNGGSSADAMHFAEELTGKFRKERPALPAISLTDPSHITCVGNDYGFEEIFARGIEAYGKRGDILIAISTSGNSKNVIKAVEKASQLELVTIGLLGKNGGSLKNRSDFELIAPGRTTDRIQEIHTVVLHILIESIERILFPQNYGA